MIWSERSRRDLRKIDQFLSDEDPVAAARILRAIRAKADQLRSFPASGPALRDELRSLTVLSTPYVIVYRIGATGAEIVRVRHVRENWRTE